MDGRCKQSLGWVDETISINETFVTLAQGVLSNNQVFYIHKSFTNHVEKLIQQPNGTTHQV